MIRNGRHIVLLVLAHALTSSAWAAPVASDVPAACRGSAAALKNQTTLRRCEAALETSYRALAQRFNLELAGRYPFAESNANDAAIQTVRAFFIDYAAQRSGLRAMLARVENARWASVRRFLDELDAAADFFRTNLAAPEGARPVRIEVAFGLLADRSQGNEQIAGMQLVTGMQATGFPNRHRTVDWTFGDTIILDLIWASASLWRPAGDPMQASLRAAEEIASFEQGGNWALLRFIEAQRPMSSAVADDTGRHLLELNVPTRDNEGKRGGTRTYIALALSGTNQKQEAVALAAPVRFPRAAPEAGK